MEILRVGYADFWPEWNDENFIEPILKKHFNVVIDQQNPDVLFHSIFGGMRQTGGYNCKKVQFLGENRRPHPGSHFSISFDPKSETNYRLPLWQVFLLNNEGHRDVMFNYKKPAKFKMDQFEKFCSFTVSNGNNFFRNNAFYQLSNYKFVDSYGRFLTNNLGLQKATENDYWRVKIAYFYTHKHKFSFAFENTSYPWYCTEKIMDSYLQGSIPLYWGSPTIEKEFNPKSFINVLKNPDWLNKIKEMDQNDDFFMDMYNEPVFTDIQRKNHKDNMNNFEEWLIKIIEK